MTLAVCTDELYPVNHFVLKELKRRGHKVVCFGALKTRPKGYKAELWPNVAHEASLAITQGPCDEGIFFCWTGTGISMAANKVPGIRAALCGDAETARGARIWNHANVLALSNRLTTPALAKKILTAWFETLPDSKGKKGVAALNRIEKQYRK